MTKTKQSESLQIEPALFNIEQICSYLNISRAEFYKIKQSGALGLLPVKFSGCGKILYSRIELEAYVKESTAQGKLIPRKLWQTIKGSKL
jgi:hypothetical protein